MNKRTKKNNNNEKEIMMFNRCEMERRLGKYKTEAIFRKCEESNMTLFDFFVDMYCIYGVDSLFLQMETLCEEYGLPLHEDDEDEYYEYCPRFSEEYNIKKAFEYRLFETDNN